VHDSVAPYKSEKAEFQGEASRGKESWQIPDTEGKREVAHRIGYDQRSSK
jgi:hypothetical protein